MLFEENFTTQKLTARCRKVLVLYLAVLWGIFTWYGLPVAQQFMAHALYQPVHAADVETNNSDTDFSCMSGSRVGPPSAFEMSIFSNYGMSRWHLKNLPYGTFVVTGTEYKVFRQSFASTDNRCSDKEPDVFYYFPLYPDWNLKDNSWPENGYTREVYNGAILTLEVSIAGILALLPFCWPQAFSAASHVIAASARFFQRVFQKVESFRSYQSGVLPYGLIAIAGGMLCFSVFCAVVARHWPGNFIPILYIAYAALHAFIYALLFTAVAFLLQKISKTETTGYAPFGVARHMVAGAKAGLVFSPVLMLGLQMFRPFAVSYVVMALAVGLLCLRTTVETNATVPEVPLWHRYILSFMGSFSFSIVLLYNHFV